MKYKPPNARFWVYVNGGYVKITLRPGDELEHYAWEPTDEGFESMWYTWSYTGHFVHRAWANNSRDCDGRYHREGIDRCHLQKLYWHRVSFSRYFDGDIHQVLQPDYPPLPLWQDVQYAQRDYAAEAAGY